MSLSNPYQDNLRDNAAVSANEPMQTEGSPEEESACWLSSSAGDIEGNRGKESTHVPALLLDAIGQAIIVTDLQDRVIYWNDAAAQQYGWSKVEATGRRLKEL